MENEKIEVQTQLVDAIINNSAVAVSRLLDAGADPNGVLDEACVSPLHFAAQNNSIEIIKLLLSAGADVNARTQPDGQTPLEIATLHEFSEAMELLS